MLDDPDEVLLRQIHPAFIDDGKLGSRPFEPTPRDQGKLSVDRSALTSAAEAFRLYTSLGRQSAAVFGVTVGEFNVEKIEVHADPIEASAETPANPAHACADYSRLPPNTIKNVAKRLRNKAVARGELFRPG